MRTRSGAWSPLTAIATIVLCPRLRPPTLVCRRLRRFRRPRPRPRAVRGPGGSSPIGACEAMPRRSGSCPAPACAEDLAGRRPASDRPRTRSPRTSSLATSGVRVPAKIVPAVTEVSDRQTAQRRNPSRICHQPASTAPQKRHVNPVAPSQPLQVAQARPVIGEPVQELIPVARILHARPRVLISHAREVGPEGAEVDSQLRGKGASRTGPALPGPAPAMLGPLSAQTGSPVEAGRSSVV